MLRIIWSDVCYRALCAWREPQDHEARRHCDVMYAWASSGAPGRRVVWAASWATFYALAPVRWFTGRRVDA